MRKKTERKAKERRKGRERRKTENESWKEEPEYENLERREKKK